jgi:tetratricopeptide (TPR) repeat protein
LGISFGTKEAKKIDNFEISMADMQAQLEKADQLFDDNKFTETISLLKSLDQSSADVLWRSGRALYKLSTEDAKSKDEYIREAFKFVQQALERDDTNFAIHKWYAILLDANSNLDGIKARVHQLETVKKHMMKAVELNPKDPTSRYILGEFAFGLADLPW